jgi:hypothetical protein
MVVSGLFPGAPDHPLAEVDERVLVPAGHGVGQLAQFDGKFVQILAHGRDSHKTIRLPLSAVQRETRST